MSSHWELSPYPGYQHSINSDIVDTNWPIQVHTSVGYSSFVSILMIDSLGKKLAMGSYSSIEFSTKWYVIACPVTDFWVTYVISNVANNICHLAKLLKMMGFSIRYFNESIREVSKVM